MLFAVQAGGVTNAGLDTAYVSGVDFSTANVGA